MTLFSTVIYLLTAFTPIDESIPNEPFAFCGKHARETITFDPALAPIFENHYQELTQSLTREMDLETLLVALCQYTLDNIFDFARCNVYDVEKMIAALDDSNEISLETFLEHKIGVCRHIALTTTSLLHRLCQESWIDGRAYIIRDTVARGRHAWTLLITPESAWHIDILLGLIADGKTADGFAHLCRYYGKSTMERQKERWAYEN